MRRTIADRDKAGASLVRNLISTNFDAFVSLKIVTILIFQPASSALSVIPSQILHFCLLERFLAYKVVEEESKRSQARATERTGQGG